LPNSRERKRIMKIAVTATGPTLDDSVESRFGRSAYFLLTDAETSTVEPLRNPNLSQRGGAGVQTARLLADKAVSIVLTGKCGPNALQTFGGVGIRVVSGFSGTVRQAVEAYNSGRAAQGSAPPARRGSGMDKGQGETRSEGLGVGGKRQVNAVRQTSAGRRVRLAPPPARSGPRPSAGEIVHLKSRLTRMKVQLDTIHRRLGACEGEQSGAAVAVVDPGKCLGCGLCADVCPRQAISLRLSAGGNRSKSHHRL
jgi:predicted Fe-Mo cluster-binding NifX family protein/NAD-dependent dihydropyrimidine dehydrogenase PreA subunit